MYRREDSEVEGSDDERAREREEEQMRDQQRERQRNEDAKSAFDGLDADDKDHVTPARCSGPLAQIVRVVFPGRALR